MFLPCRLAVGGLLPVDGNLACEGSLWELIATRDAERHDLSGALYECTRVVLGLQELVDL